MSFFTYTGGNLLVRSLYTHSAQRTFQPDPSIIYVPPVSTTRLPPAYGSQAFNKDTFVAVTVKKKNILIGLIVGGALFVFGILAAITWYIISTSNCIPCATSKGCVAPLQWCDGIPQCANGEDEECCKEDFTMLLFGACTDVPCPVPSRLQETKPESPVSCNLNLLTTEPFQLARSDFVLYARHKDYSWRPVCYDHWNKDGIKQVCKTMGYHRNYSNYGSASVSSIESSEFLTLNNSIKKRNIYYKLMISKSCQSGLVVTIRCIECGTRKSLTNTTGRIIGGAPASRGEFPWQVSLQVRNRHICGGSIVTPYWIVTAAHCVERFRSAFYWRVHAGKVLLSSTHPIFGHKVEMFIQHHMYDTKTKDYDIALMKLLTPFTITDKVRPICLPNYKQIFPTGSQSWVTGWGDKEEKGTMSEVLQKVAVPLINSEDCRRTYYSIILPRMICAGYPHGGSDACQTTNLSITPAVDHFWRSKLPTSPQKGSVCSPTAGLKISMKAGSAGSMPQIRYPISKAFGFHDNAHVSSPSSLKDPLCVIQLCSAYGFKSEQESPYLSDVIKLQPVDLSVRQMTDWIGLITDLSQTHCQQID